MRTHQLIGHRSSAYLSILLLVFMAASSSAATLERVATPSQLYGELFTRVQMERVFADGKTFVDAVPRGTPAQVMEAYRQASAREGFDLQAFVAQHFDVPRVAETEYRTQQGQDVRTHIDQLWEVLRRKPGAQPLYSSKLPLPMSYVVPGGRFGEIYYWDSYFTMLGLEESGRADLISSMIDNFAFLIDQYGHIPNGNRSYYVSRSQPPFFAAMVELEARRGGKEVFARRLPQLKREYAFWMDGAQTLQPNAAHRRVVRMPDGEILNRYWDDRDTPRDESYREDVLTAQDSQRPLAEVYRDLRAAAESGWDFSSRWLADGEHLTTIRTTQFIPVDLNSLLYQLERTIAHACELAADTRCAEQMAQRAASRRAAIVKYLWNERQQVFSDYDRVAQTLSDRVTAASVYPLYFRVADERQARGVARTVRERLLKAHGIATTEMASGQQWDAPNGWAPLQWLAIRGLDQYGERTLAATIAQRWVAKNLEVFRESGKLVEKYDVIGAGEGGGGEYPNQDGFGWTNGVLRKLLALYPRLHSPLRSP